MSKDPWRDDTNGRKDREVVVRQVGVGDLECVVVVVDSFLHKTHLLFFFFHLKSVVYFAASEVVRALLDRRYTVQCFQVLSNRINCVTTSFQQEQSQSQEES
jgi:hypothetical protein